MAFRLYTGGTFVQFKTYGFTLLEILVVIGLFTLLGGAALLVSMETYHGSNFRADRDLFVAALEHARAEAMNNVCLGTCTDGKSHGVHLESGQYVIFQGTLYDTNDPQNAVFKIHTTAIQGGGDIIFSQLSGATTATSTMLSDGAGHTSLVTINSEGQITWTH